MFPTVDPKLFLVRELTTGFTEDTELRLRYEREGFGLETVFDRPELAQARAAQLQQDFALLDDDIRLVQHISTPETRSRSTWEVYIRAGKGIPVLFLQRGSFYESEARQNGNTD
ncbi:MAG: hypothetical protein NZ602_10690 [Thermoguttaceae bacterium]|nr:hypothetical protein [Thermoguttaceae bacterium]